MKNSPRKILMAMTFLVGALGCSAPEKSDNLLTNEDKSAASFSFAFITDLHLNNNHPESFEALKQAVDTARAKNADFIITGGDNVDVDAMGMERMDEAKALFDKYRNVINETGADFKLTIGNHDRYWHMGNIEETYGSALFSEFFGDTYYAWEHKGVKFIHLNTAEVCEDSYCISETQKQWFQQTLDQTPKTQPLIIIAHVPFLSLYYPALDGYYTHTDVFKGFKDVWQMFSEHNVQLVLQGHMHLFEEMNVLGTQFITGGALSANWWGGSFHGTEEGFVMIHWDGEKMTWDYTDIGWEVEISQ
ncbi:MAG: metallophosphoesterase family protein [Bacteroidota bacterium]